MVELATATYCSVIHFQVSDLLAGSPLCTFLPLITLLCVICSCRRLTLFIPGNFACWKVKPRVQWSWCSRYPVKAPNAHKSCTCSEHKLSTYNNTTIIVSKIVTRTIPIELKRNYNSILPHHSLVQHPSWMNTLSTPADFLYLSTSNMKILNNK
jgi:hypothetical protein